MRVSPDKRAILKHAIHAVFPPDARVFLFGSQLGDNRRGGDIDLMVVSSLRRDALETAKIAAIAKIHLALGEQKIDRVVTSDPARDTRPVVREASLHGVEL